MRWFQFAGVGNQTSMPMPAEVEGALAGPGLPGPMLSLTKQRSFAATGGAGDAAVPDRAIGSPFRNALTSVTVVFASGLKAVFIESSQASATGDGGGGGGVGVGLESS